MNSNLMQIGVMDSIGKQSIIKSETQINLFLNYFHEVQVRHLWFRSQLYTYSGLCSRGLGWLSDIILA